MNFHSAIECRARLISMARNAHVSARHSPRVRDVIQAQVTFSASKDGQAVIVIKVSSIYFAENVRAADSIVLLRSYLSTRMSTWPVRESTGPMSLPSRLDRRHLSNIALHQGRTLERLAQWEIPLRERSLSEM